MRPASVIVRLVAPVLVLLSAASPALAVRAPEPGTLLPELDLRLSRNARYQAVVALGNGVKQADLIAGPAAEPGPAREAALLELARTAGPIEVRWDEVTGSPRLLFARAGFLTAPDARAPETIAREFVLQHRALFLLDADKAKDLRVERVVPASAVGAVVRFEQSVAGIDVLHGHLAVSLTGEGRVVSVMGGHVSGAGRLASAVPAHDAAQALSVLAATAGVTLEETPSPLRADALSATFRAKGLRGESRVALTIIPTAGGPRLGWHAAL